MARVLIIDDNEGVCRLLSHVVKVMGHEPTCSVTLKDGLKELYSTAFDAVLLDVKFPEGDGLEVLPKIRSAPSSPEVVIMTGFADVDGAEIAIKSGVKEGENLITVGFQNLINDEKVTVLE